MSRKVTYTAGFEGETRELTVDVHDMDADPWSVGQKLKWVGREIPRLDGAAKATGTAQYTYDVRREGLAFAGLVFSPHAHATVKSAGFPGKAPAGVLATKVFADKRITYAGGIVAAICADSPGALFDALDAFHVDYDVQPHVVAVEDALKEGAPRVDPRRDNDAGGGPMRRGDRDGFTAADVRVQGEYRTQIQTHSALEPHGCVVEVDAQGKTTVWASTQAASFFAGRPRGAFRRALGEAGRDVRVITDHMGGGFGAKFGALEWDVLCAGLAAETKRPVMLLLSRRLEHLLGGNRPDSIQKLELLGNQDGKFIGLKGETWGTAGNNQGGAGCANFMAYEWPGLEMSQHTVRTFTARAAAFRAPRHPQGFFAVESLIDKYADTIGMDPLEVRMKNDPHPVRQMQWKLGAERIGWAKNRRTKPGSDKGPVKRGVGCAAARWSQAGRGSWVVQARINADGEILVRSGVQDIGTGTRTLLAIMVGEEVGVNPRDIRVEIGDTNFPPGPPSGGSTTAPSMGPVAREAGLRLREGLAKRVAEAWGVDVAAVGFENGEFRTGDGARKANVKQAARLLGDETLEVSGQRRRNWESALGETAGCQFAEVSVDTETGVVRVDRVVAIHDCGKVINELASRSQVNGGVIQGISYALYEERLLDKNQGDMVNPTFDTYKIMGMKDCPQIDVVMTSVIAGYNNAGMMGLGEPATVPTAAAVANAVYNALGVQVTELPMTPKRVLAALEGNN